MNCPDCGKPLTEHQLRQHATRCRPCARREWHKQRRANLTTEQRERIREASRIRDARRRQDPERQAKLSLYRRQQKMRKRDATSEPYTLAEITLRDQGRCGLCARLITGDHPYPHPLARTIDHILPLAMGGDDTRANVQLAHWYCNQQKSTRGSQQLRLVG